MEEESPVKVSSGQVTRNTVRYTSSGKTTTKARQTLSTELR